MSSKPLVSCIIIFFNAEKFFDEAIESVFAQTYDRWELLLVDDGSTDGSTAIACNYAKEYPKNVRYLDHEGHQNRGMSASRNLGIRQAKGDYISYIDGDDVWLPNKLQQQVAILESQPEAAMVYGPLLHWRSWTGNPENTSRDSLAGAGKKGVHPYRNSLVKPPKLLTLFLEDDYFIPGGILIRREAIDRVGGYEEGFRGLREDAVFYLKLCIVAKVFVSSEVWYKYRVHPDSCNYVSWVRGEVDDADLVYLNWFKEYLSKQGIKDPEVWHAVRRALWRCRHAWLYRMIDYKCYIGLLKGLTVTTGRWLLPISIRRWLWKHWIRYKYSLLRAGR